MLCRDLQTIKIFHDLEDGHQSQSLRFQAAQVADIILKFLAASAGVALLTNLYRTAMNFEKGHSAENPNKIAFYNQVTEIDEKVTEIYRQ